MTLSIKQIAEALGGRCNRTATKYCKDHGIKIYPLDTGRGRWVYAAEFYKVRHAPLIPNLVIEYGSKAHEALEAYIANDPIKLMLLKQERIIQHKEKRKDEPVGKIANRFLERIKNKSSVKPKL